MLEKRGIRKKNRRERVEYRNVAIRVYRVYFYGNYIFALRDTEISIGYVENAFRVQISSRQSKTGDSDFYSRVGVLLYRVLASSTEQSSRKPSKIPDCVFVLAILNNLLAFHACNFGLYDSTVPICQNKRHIVAGIAIKYNTPQA